MEGKRETKRKNDKKKAKKKDKRENSSGKTLVYCSLLSSIHGLICIAELPTALPVVKCFRVNTEYLFRVINGCCMHLLEISFICVLSFMFLSYVGKEEYRLNKWRNSSISRLASQEAYIPVVEATRPRSVA